MGKLYKKAFTLIELLVTIALMLLIMVVAIPAFNRYGDRAELNSKVEEMQSILEKGNSLATAPAKGSNGAVVTIDTTNNTTTAMTLESVWFTNPTSATDFTYNSSSVVDTVSLPQGKITIANLSSDQKGTTLKIYFVAPGKIYFYDSVNASFLDTIVLTLTSERISVSKTITVNKIPNFKIIISS